MVGLDATKDSGRLIVKYMHMLRKRQRHTLRRQRCHAF